MSERKDRRLMSKMHFSLSFFVIINSLNTYVDNKLHTPFSVGSIHLLLQPRRIFLTVEGLFSILRNCLLEV